MEPGRARGPSCLLRRPQGRPDCGCWRLDGVARARPGGAHSAGEHAAVRAQHPCRRRRLTGAHASGGRTIPRPGSVGLGAAGRGQGVGKPGRGVRTAERGALTLASLALVSRGPTASADGTPLPCDRCIAPGARSTARAFHWLGSRRDTYPAPGARAPSSRSHQRPGRSNPGSRARQA